MKILVVLACVAVASARPEAPLQGYNYGAPAPRPIVHSAVSSSAASSGGHGGYYQAPAPAPVFHPAPAPAPVFHHHQAQAAPAYHGHAHHSAGFGGSSGFVGSSGFGSSIGSSGAGFGSLSSSGFGSAVSSGASFAPQQTVVQKHIYVHVPPQEPEETRPQQVLSQGVPRKHYKIIFIKTPNVQPSAAQIALQQAQQEEKTIVYVLVKKPDDLADINIPQLAPLPPSKPEVYFIKYKANKGAAGSAAGIANAISGSLGGAEFGGAISSGSALSSGSGFGGAISSGSASSSSSSGHGFDAALGSSGSAISSGSLPHTEYGAPTGGHQGYH